LSSPGLWCPWESLCAHRQPVNICADLPGAEQRLRDFLIGRFGGPQTYAEQRGHPREAGDGYKVALAEVDPAFAVLEIILADKRDSKLLDAKEGPFRIVAPGDKRAARWVREVTALKLIAVK